jgi:hypothetical protein
VGKRGVIEVLTGRGLLCGVWGSELRAVVAMNLPCGRLYTDCELDRWQTTKMQVENRGEIPASSRHLSIHSLDGHWHLRCCRLARH